MCGCVFVRVSLYVRMLLCYGLFPEITVHSFIQESVPISRTAWARQSPRPDYFEAIANTILRREASRSSRVQYTYWKKMKLN